MGPCCSTVQLGLCWNLTSGKEIFVLRVNPTVQNFHLIPKPKLPTEFRKVEYTYLCVFLTVLFLFSTYCLCEIAYLYSFVLTVKL